MPNRPLKKPPRGRGKPTRVVTTKPDGSVIETYEPMIYEYLEYLPPSDAAIRMWLMNRRPDQWRERVDHNLSIDPNSPFDRMMRRIDGESRRLPPGNDPDADREYAAADAIQRKRSPAQRAGN